MWVFDRGRGDAASGQGRRLTVARRQALYAFVLGLVFLLAAVVLTPAFVGAHLTRAGASRADLDRAIQAARAGFMFFAVASFALSVVLGRGLSFGRIVSGMVSKRWPLVALAAAVIVWTVVGLDHGVDVDEGIVVVAAERILGGEVPYRDFVAVYTPGVFYLLTAVFKTTGSWLIVSRLVDKVLVLAIVLMTFALAKHVAPHPWVWLAPVVPLNWLATQNALRPTAPATLLGLASELGLLRFLRTRSTPSLAASGFAAGLAVLFRQDLGVYTVIAVMATLVVAAWWNYPGSSVTARLRLAIKGLAVFAISAAAPVIVVMAYLSALVGWRELGWQLVVTRLLIHRVVYPGIVYPGLAWRGLTLRVWLHDALLGVPFWIALGAIVWGFGRVGVGWRTRGTVDGRDLPILSLGMLGLAWSLHAAMSPDDMHLAPLLAPVGLLLAVLVATQPSRATIRRACGWAAIAVLVMHPVVMLRKLGDMHEAIWRDPTLLPFGGRARGIRADEGYVRALGATIAYVHARVPSGEPIFVGITPHGHRPGNTSILYFFIDRPIPTRYHELTLAWPRPGGQEEVARDLLERRVRYLVLETAIPPPDTTAPAPTDQALGVLDRSIAPRYREERQFGPFHIYAMRGD